jgi:hypothetical protein
MCLGLAFCLFLFWCVFDVCFGVCQVSFNSSFCSFYLYFAFSCVWFFSMPYLSIVFVILFVCPFVSFYLSFCFYSFCFLFVFLNFICVSFVCPSVCFLIVRMCQFLFNSSFCFFLCVFGFFSLIHTSENVICTKSKRA